MDGDSKVYSFLLKLLLPASTTYLQDNGEGEENALINKQLPAVKYQFKYSLCTHCIALHCIVLSTIFSKQMNVGTTTLGGQSAINGTWLSAWINQPLEMMNNIQGDEIIRSIIDF